MLPNKNNIKNSERKKEKGMNFVAHPHHGESVGGARVLGELEDGAVVDFGEGFRAGGRSPPWDVVGEQQLLRGGGGGHGV